MKKINFFFGFDVIRFFFFCGFIYLFYVEKAFGDDGNLKQPKQVSLNKVGHGKIKPSIF